MTNTLQSPERHTQISAWLRGLSTIAWSDGHFDPEERDMIVSLTQDEIAPNANIDSLESISPEELADTLGADPDLAENFLRTAVMVAIADGVYSPAEDEILQQFCTALGRNPDVLASLRLTLQPLSITTDEDRVQAQATVSEDGLSGNAATPISSGLQPPAKGSGLEPLRPVKEWLDELNIHDPSVARFLCKMIPPQCPFERDVKLFGKKVVHIPPMCKLNPLYEQLVGIRFRALSYLADDCGEDISPYC